MRHQGSATDTSEVAVYRIGWRTGRPLRFTLGLRWKRLRERGWLHPTYGVSAFHPKRIVHRPWQAEVVTSECRCNAARGLTPQAAEARVRRAHRRAATKGRCALTAGGAR
jgi:hypothetical protein